MSTPTPKQIGRRAIDYDSQIRQGLEDGDIRQVVKRLGSDLVSGHKPPAFFLTHILLDVGTVFVPPRGRDSGPKGCLSEGTLPVSIRSGVEQQQERRRLPRRPTGPPCPVRQGETALIPHRHARLRSLCHSCSPRTFEGQTLSPGQCPHPPSHTLHPSPSPTTCQAGPVALTLALTITTTSDPEARTEGEPTHSSSRPSHCPR